MGEVPSLPRLLHSILTTAFNRADMVPADYEGPAEAIIGQVRHMAEAVLAAFLGMVEGEVLDQELSLQVEQVRVLADLHTSPSPSHASGVEVAVRVGVAARMTHLGLG